MREIILNEREWLMSALENNDMGGKPVYAINLYAKYLLSEGYDKASMKKKIEEFLLRCDSSVSLVSWDSAITRAIRCAGDRPLIVVDAVNVTAAEMETISSANGIRRQRLMFTLLCLAKYHNAVVGRSDYWTNVETRDLFRMANVDVGNTMRGLLLNDLIQCGHITKGRRVDNTNLKINYADEESISVATVHDFRNLGYQYTNLIHGGYVECVECGLLVKKKSNRQIYCPACARRINAESSRRRYHEPAA